MSSPSSLIRSGAGGGALPPFQVSFASIISADEVQYDFDDVISDTGTPDPAFKVNGVSPTARTGGSGTAVVYRYPVVSIGDTWSVTTIPTQITCAGKTFLIPESGSLGAGRP